MKTFPECLPCLLRLAESGARRATGDAETQATIIREAEAVIAACDRNVPPPVTARTILDLIRDRTGNPDPYRADKERDNRRILSLLPDLRKRVNGSDHPLEAAIRLAIAGNLMDSGIAVHEQPTDVRILVGQALSAPVLGDLPRAAAALLSAHTILYIGDNAGEIVFDRLLIETILGLSPRARITCAVRSGPALNDVTLADAETVGMTRLVPVIETGSDIPGILLPACSPAFRERFAGADLILSKGQGNFETLAEASAPLLFFLKAKCTVVARHLGCPRGTAVVRG